MLLQGILSKWTQTEEEDSNSQKFWSSCREKQLDWFLGALRYFSSPVVVLDGERVSERGRERCRDAQKLPQLFA